MASLSFYNKPPVFSQEQFTQCVQWALKMERAVTEGGAPPMERAPAVYDIYRDYNPSAIDPVYAKNLQQQHRQKLNLKEIRELGGVPAPAQANEVVSLRALELVVDTLKDAEDLAPDWALLLDARAILAARSGRVVKTGLVTKVYAWRRLADLLLLRAFRGLVLRIHAKDVGLSDGWDVAQTRPIRVRRCELETFHAIWQTATTMETKRWRTSFGRHLRLAHGPSRQETTTDTGPAAHAPFAAAAAVNDPSAPPSIPSFNPSLSMPLPPFPRQSTSDHPIPALMFQMQEHALMPQSATDTISTTDIGPEGASTAVSPSTSHLESFAALPLAAGGSEYAQSVTDEFQGLLLNPLDLATDQYLLLEPNLPLPM
ncbi:hypothetical protein AURDEDRAFT_176565 [Auricularia subglabra TFB-10046 SS5]|uniref:Uncharacterized protein n=1 Tax=Auricularia subglabra (strain TFB-10046 / SS5) TaxID=717982 RepID=J0WPM4_AURST|nr:hypothetical protein AURDEDRAFT_176565 [Auricularia subglabra TFB-10046 SS5]